MKNFVVAFFIFTSSIPILANTHQCSSLFERFSNHFDRNPPRRTVDFNSVVDYTAVLRQQNINGKVQDYFDPKLDTRVYVANNSVPDGNGKKMLVDPQSDVVFLFLHGSGTLRSSGKNFIHLMNSLVGVNISSLALDLPFHGDGPSSALFNDPKYVTQWLNKVVLELKKSGKKVFLAGHSFGPSIAMQYMYDYPFGVDGALLVSPVAFNRELRKWYDTETARMKFGEQGMVSATEGGLWGDRMLNAFGSHQKAGVGDPTLLNPDLRILAITGDREEYAPGPVGGRKNLPTGKNTYSIPDALVRMFQRVEIIVGENVGHYIFKHVDSDGFNIVERALFEMSSLRIQDEKALREEKARALVANRTSEQILWTKYHEDEIFAAWARYKNLEGPIKNILRQQKSAVAKNILELFRLENERRKKEITEQILKICERHPEIARRYSSEIEDLKKLGLRDSALFDELKRVVDH